MRTARAIALGAVAVTVTAHAFSTRDNTIPSPADYRHWTHVKSTLVGAQGPSFAGSGGYHHFYADDQALRATGRGRSRTAPC